jgi:hypothetical protein
VAAFGCDAPAHQASDRLHLHPRIPSPSARPADQEFGCDGEVSGIGWSQGGCGSRHCAAHLLRRNNGPLAQTRRWVETALNQLTERYHVKRVWARNV